ncbi:MAG TPA: RHS repeat-associated core domain-containing protein, partial [Bdellovibrionota bacterium]|nr:RHS repeat-associated core domain-containing protein [Bdellovibrionota bacterium]
LDPGDGRVSSIILHDRLGRAVGIVDADDDTFETRYDGLSRVIQTMDPTGNEVESAYDKNSNLLTTRGIEKSPLIAANEEFLSAYTYDSLNRIETLVEPNGQTTTSQYDSRDNLIKTIDALGNQTEMRHDRLSRLLDSRTYLSSTGTNASAGSADPTQGGGDGVITISQTWDALHRLKSRTDDKLYATQYTYDDLDRKRRSDYHDGTFETWSYNADSELDQHRNQNNSVETWTHDAESRPTQVSVNNGGATALVLGTTLKTWGYDGLDRVTRAFDNNGAGEDVEYLYAYDSLSRKLRETQMIGVRPTLNVDAEWQGAGRRVSDTYPNLRKVFRNYDGLDRLSEIREGAGGPLIAGFEYVGPFRDSRTTLGNGAVLDKRNDSETQTISGLNAGYDNNRRDTRHTWKTSTALPITAYVNTYNGPSGIGTNRRITETREHLSNHLDTYSFDSKYRMLSFNRNGTTPSTRLLDGADSMTAFDDEGVPRNPVVDGIPSESGMNQYSSFDGKTQEYDDNSALRADGDLRFVYDYSDRLVEVRDFLPPNTLLVSYAYAPNNRRVLKSFSAGGSIRYLYNGWQVVEERDGGNALLRQYVDGRGIDEHVQIKDATQVGAPVFYYHGNSQGFVGALSDSGQNVVEFYEYSWLGQPSIFAADGTTPLSASVVGNPYMFQGRYLDSETGLYYFRNRYYDPKTGRFIQIDPSGNRNWEHRQGNGFSAFGEDGWNKGDPMGLEEDRFEQLVKQLGDDSFKKREEASAKLESLQRLEKIGPAVNDFLKRKYCETRNLETKDRLEIMDRIEKLRQKYEIEREEHLARRKWRYLEEPKIREQKSVGLENKIEHVKRLEKTEGITPKLRRILGPLLEGLGIKEPEDAGYEFRSSWYLRQNKSVLINEALERERQAQLQEASQKGQAKYEEWLVSQEPKPPGPPPEPPITPADIARAAAVIMRDLPRLEIPPEELEPPQYDLDAPDLDTRMRLAR